MNSDKIEQIRAEWLAINQLNPKEKFKKLKVLSFKLEISELISLEQIDLYSEIIITAKKVVGFPGQLNKKLQQLSQLKLKLLGIDLSDLKIILKENFYIDLFSAEVGICDEQYLHHGIEDNGEITKQIISEGKRLFCCTASDGNFKMQVRVVNLDYPVFLEKEYKTLIAYSEILMLNAPTGSLVITESLSNIPLKKIIVSGNIEFVLISIKKRLILSVWLG